MMGTEGAAVAAGASLVGKVLNSDKAAEEKVLEAAGDAPSFQGAAELRARRLATREVIKLKLLEPFGRLVGIQREYFDGDSFLRDLTNATSHIPPESIVSPKASIAGPTLEGLAMSLDEEELKQMYLRLLASASDARRNNVAHVSFVTLIGQLSAEEASAFTVVAAGKIVALVSLRSHEGSPHESYKLLFDHHADERLFPGVHPRDLQFFVDNWVRLGLVHVSYDAHLTDEKAYEWADTSSWVSGLRAAVESQNESNVLEVTKGSMRVTAVGRRFASVVLPQEDEVAAEDADA